MKHFVIVTALRGPVNPPEPLDPDNQRILDHVVAGEAYYAQLERDPPLSHWRQVAMAKRPVKSDHRDRPFNSRLHWWDVA
jgi:hypothetical protein